jgi:hypothetical protein
MEASNAEGGIQLIESHPQAISPRNNHQPGLPAGSASSNGINERVSFISRARKVAEQFGESYFFTGMMTLFTFWALFQGDIKFAATEKSADDAFEVIISILFFAFLFEIFLQSFYKDDYCSVPTWKALPDETIWDTWYRRLQIGGFYFWLDIIATMSLLLDVSLLCIYLNRTEKNFLI